MGGTDRQTSYKNGKTEIREAIRKHQLPDTVVSVLDSYDRKVDERDRFHWKWAHHLFPKVTLSSVALEHADAVCDQKLLALLYVSVLDDVAERYGDRATFEEASKIPFDHQVTNPDRDGVDRALLSFADDVWNRFSQAVTDGPRATEFEEILLFDLKQVLTAIDYSYVANHDIEFVNGSELGRYEAHNMMMFVFMDIDLVHSPTFDRLELSKLRRIVERAQAIVRMGNWITTWERELAEGDITSGIVVYALENGIVSTDELRALQRNPADEDVEAVAQTIHDHDVEEVFLRRWREEIEAARAVENSIDSVDVDAYLDGIETAMDYHLASRGLI